MMGQLERRAEAISGEFNSQNVANTLWAYATMGTKPGERMMGQLERRAEAISGEFTSQNIVDLRWAYSSLGLSMSSQLEEVLVSQERLLSSSLSVFIAGAVVAGQGVSNAHCDAVSVAAESIAPSDLSQASTVRSRVATALSEVSTTVAGAERHQLKDTWKRQEYVKKEPLSAGADVVTDTSERRSVRQHRVSSSHQPVSSSQPGYQKSPVKALSASVATDSAAPEKEPDASEEGWSLPKSKGKRRV